MNRLLVNKSQFKAGLRLLGFTDSQIEARIADPEYGIYEEHGTLLVPNNWVMWSPPATTPNDNQLTEAKASESEK